MINNVAEELNKKFEPYIEEFALDKNQISLSLLSENAFEVCTYLSKQLNLGLVSMFASDERELESGTFIIYYIFSNRSENYFIELRSQLPTNELKYKSVANHIYNASWYEREIKDMFGLEPIGHPLPKKYLFHNNWPEGNYPLRKDFNKKVRPEWEIKPQSFLEVQGEGVFEIPVGPVHAGIIEPGHFRFSVAGESIINMETQLFYVHKGVEKISEGMSLTQCYYLSERISGDESFSNSLAYCQAVERIAGVEVPERALLTRVVFAELERLTSHFGDLAGICLDVAYGFAAYQFRLLRGWSYVLADELSGMRFLRSINKIGGVRKDFLSNKEKNILEFTKKTRKELEDTIKIIKENNLFLDRLEGTGVLLNRIAVDLNVTGPGGRASGVDYDVRRDHPYAGYSKLNFKVSRHNNGDVNCRMNVRLEECLQSIYIIEQVMELLEQGKIYEAIGDLKAYESSIGYTESPRGENIHWVMTAENNTIYRYKIRTPSVCNWLALPYAVKDNIIADFPVINKSFNLSYAGNDL
ncbi:MAG: NADH-quinone oxidoreductase subunit C [Vulcanibacillus sp.]